MLIQNQPNGHQKIRTPLFLVGVMLVLSMKDIVVLETIVT